MISDDGLPESLETATVETSEEILKPSMIAEAAVKMPSSASRKKTTKTMFLKCQATQNHSKNLLKTL